jgi:hypothetical protein
MSNLKKMRDMRYKDRSKFVDVLVSTGDKELAAESSGYAEGSIHGLMHDEEIKTLVQSQLESKIVKTDMLDKLFIDRLEMRNYKIKKLLDIIERCGNGENIYDQNGELNTIYDNRSIIAAISELNKMSGDYAPTKTESVNLNLDVDVKRVEELIKTKFKSEY